MVELLCFSDSQGDALEPTNMGLKEQKGSYSKPRFFCFALSIQNVIAVL